MNENRPQETESLIEKLAELTAEKIQEGGEQVEVTHRVVTKNNAVDRHSLSITRTDSNVAPQIYVDDIIFCATNEMLCEDFSKLMQT